MNGPPCVGAELRLTAFHEAGHAVAALVTRCELREVSVVPAPGRLGSSVFRAPRRPSGQARREAITRHLAGPAAEAIHLGHNAVEFLEAEASCGGGATDFAAARRACGAGGETAYLSWHWRRTIGLLERWWPGVEAVARELLDAEAPILGIQARLMIDGAMTPLTLPPAIERPA